MRREFGQRAALSAAKMRQLSAAFLHCPAGPYGIGEIAVRRGAEALSLGTGWAGFSLRRPSTGKSPAQLPESCRVSATEGP
jgi:hypothetical protein